jgi:hypothetical protein
LLLLIDGDWNAFKDKRIRLPLVQKVMKRYPIVPLLGRCCPGLEEILQAFHALSVSLFAEDLVCMTGSLLPRAGHYEADLMDAAFGRIPDEKTVKAP